MWRLQAPSTPSTPGLAPPQVQNSTTGTQFVGGSPNPWHWQQHERNLREQVRAVEERLPSWERRGNTQERDCIAKPLPNLKALKAQLPSPLQTDDFWWPEYRTDEWGISKEPIEITYEDDLPVVLGVNFDKAKRCWTVRSLPGYPPQSQEFCVDDFGALAFSKSRRLAVETASLWKNGLEASQWKKERRIDAGVTEVMEEHSYQSPVAAVAFGKGKKLFTAEHVLKRPEEV
uniref:Uncharacterized protein n=1 Tax=Chromera velia CCMP2878 TaxID=1169474 RepID=A0A0G4IDC9_9ALVE|eukprot:Cvel_13378.t1-p1 / transcript=Cvel_13378.t1 / gene=Cvel_13378 / organism=Chromera_velia_CCMP2878 / gene_product=hypothetical protein / transcript_product=hypothetical protein / location=Cvel_scaffold910:41282-46707(+) / protein_length=230 / sequence_SO=supercontig / SO=protein_coding / is_pseudo=false